MKSQLKKCVIKLTKLPVSLGQSVKVVGTITNGSRIKQLPGGNVANNFPKVIFDVKRKRIKAKLGTGLQKHENNKNITNSLGRVTVAKPSTLFCNISNQNQVVISNNTEGDDVICVTDIENDVTIDDNHVDMSSVKKCENDHMNEVDDDVIFVENDSSNEDRLSNKTLDVQLLTNNLSEVIPADNKTFICNICYDCFNNKPDFIDHVRFHVQMNFSDPLSIVNQNNSTVQELKTNLPCNKEIGNNSTVEKTNSDILSPIFVDVEDNFVRNNPDSVAAIKILNQTDDTQKAKLDSSKKNIVEIISVNNEAENGKLEYRCAYCNVDFRKPTAIENHMRFSHPNITPLYHCLWCDEISSELQKHNHSVEIQAVNRLKRKYESSKTTSRYMCYYCTLPFVSAVAIQKHMKAEHEGFVSKYYCYACKKVVFSLKTHVHVWPKPIKQLIVAPTPSERYKPVKKLLVLPIESEHEKCKICGEIIKSDTERYKHETLYHRKLKTYTNKKEKPRKEATVIQLPGDSSENVIKCRVCGCTFQTYAACDEHEVRYHFNKYCVYECLYCKSTYETHAEIVYHLSSHHNELKPAYNCKKCCKIYTSSDTHEHSVKCRICNQSCSNMEERNDHELTIHTSNNHKMNKNSDKFVYQCTLCGDKFLNAEKITEHVEYFHSNRKGNMYQCLICYKSLLYVKYHSHNPNITCRCCSRTFADRIARDKHEIENHLCPASIAENTYNVYACLYCNQQFKYFAKIASHTTVKHNKPSYRCIQCNKNYSFAERHVHESKLKCRMCDKTFLDKSVRSSHELEHHASDIPKYLIQYFACVNCSACFKSYRSVQQHISSAHKSILKPMYRCTKCGREFLVTINHSHLSNNEKLAVNKNIVTEKISSTPCPGKKLDDIVIKEEFNVSGSELLSQVVKEEAEVTEYKIMP